jgi:hypothetical protein
MEYDDGWFLVSPFPRDEEMQIYIDRAVQSNKLIYIYISRRNKTFNSCGYNMIIINFFSFHSREAGWSKHKVMNTCLSVYLTIVLLSDQESNVELLFSFFSFDVVVVSPIVYHDVDHWLPLHKVKSIKKSKTKHRHTASSFIQQPLKGDWVCMRAIVGLLTVRMLERPSTLIHIYIRRRTSNIIVVFVQADK